MAGAKKLLYLALRKRQRGQTAKVFRKQRQKSGRRGEPGFNGDRVSTCFNILLTCLQPSLVCATCADVQIAALPLRWILKNVFVGRRCVLCLNLPAFQASTTMNECQLASACCLSMCWYAASKSKMVKMVRHTTIRLWGIAPVTRHVFSATILLSANFGPCYPDTCSSARAL